ncbi:MAG: outer membrane protein [Candidatus Kryptoniota bacterium]
MCFLRHAPKYLKHLSASGSPKKLPNAFDGSTTRLTERVRLRGIIRAIEFGWERDMRHSYRIFASVLASAIAVAAPAAIAADLSYGGGLKDGPVYAPAWTGFYVGINGGGSFGASENLVVTNSKDTSQADIGQFYRHAGFGGGQIGYDLGNGFGFARNIVFGVEADFQGSGIDSSFPRTLSYDGLSTAFAANQTIDYFGTVRGRLGYAFDRTLIYATGGFAYANVDTKLHIANASYTNTISSNQMETGYAIGGGVEYALTRSWSVKAEYQYIDLGDQTVSGARPGVSPTVIDSMQVDDNFHTVRAGVNYHFGADYAPLK